MMSDFASYSIPGATESNYLSSMTPLPSYQHTILDQDLILLPQKAIFWTQMNMLIIADIHLGKAAHFRKSGIAVSENVHTKDLEMMTRLISQFPVQQVLFLGDLFHSKINESWTAFLNWMESHPGVEFILVKGNHDILPAQAYYHPKLKLYEDKLVMYPFLFSHIPEQSGMEGELYNLSGHIHPGFRLEGKGKQGISLPCFYFGKTGAVLPAFGSFTGHINLEYSNDSRIFLVANEKIISL
jgi:uncharacterized protein